MINNTLNYLFNLKATGNTKMSEIKEVRTASQRMPMKSEYNVLRDNNLKKHFNSSLTAPSPKLLSFTEYNRAFGPETISKKPLALRTPLPALASIVSTTYTKGILQVLQKQYEPVIRMKRPKLKSINDGFSNFILWRYKCDANSSFYLDAVRTNMEAMNFAICLGFASWYAFIPQIMFYFYHPDINALISPEEIQRYKEMTRGWAPQFIRKSADILLSPIFKDEIMYDAGRYDIINAASSAASSSTPSITNTELTEMSEKINLRKLILSCLLACLISSVTYASVSGSELTSVCGTELTSVSGADLINLFTEH